MAFCGSKVNTLLKGTFETCYVSKILLLTDKCFCCEEHLKGHCVDFALQAQFTHHAQYFSACYNFV